MMKRRKLDFENNVTALIGKQLERVRYFEIRYESDSPMYFVGSFPGHLLDFGCDLEMSDGSVFGVIWDGEFFQYGVGVVNKSLADQLGDSKVFDVSSDVNWACLIGQSIVNVKVYWSWVQYEGEAEKIYYPQELEVEFENGSIVYFSASRYNEEKDSLWGISDDIAVVFGREAAQKYCIGPYASIV